MVDRARAAHGAKLPDHRLHVAGVVDGARGEQRRAAVPVPVDAKARQRVRVDRLLQRRRAPVAAAVGRHVDALHFAAAGPRETVDLVIAAVEDHLSARRRRDDALRLVNPRVLTMLAAGHQIDVVQRLLARVPRLVSDLQSPQPLDARHALHARNEQPQRVALFGPQHFAVLPVADHHIVERHRQRDRARERRAVGAFGEHEGRLRVDPDLVEQRRERHAGPLAASDHAVRVLHRGHGDLRPLHAGVGAAFDEVDARHRRKAHQVIEREQPRIFHHAVDHQPVLVRIDVGHAGVMTLEVQTRGRDDAEEVLQRRERDRRMRGAREPGAFAATDVRFVFRGHTVRRRENRRTERAVRLGNVRRKIAAVVGARETEPGSRRQTAAQRDAASKEAAPRGAVDRRRCRGGRTNAARCPVLRAHRCDANSSRSSRSGARSSMRLAICMQTVRQMSVNIGSATL